jgi:3-oxoacyl-[acyl-carrier-protein] synthase II
METPRSGLNHDQVWITGIGLLTAQATGGRDAALGQRARILDAEDPGDAAGLPLGDVDFAALLGSRGLRHMSRGTLALLAAARLALEDAGLDDATAYDVNDIGVAAGTATATAGQVADFDRTTLVEGPQAVNPAIFPQTVWNGPACQVAIRFGLRGPNLTVCSGLLSGYEAILAAARLIRRSRARIVLAGGFEEITPYFQVLFEDRAGRATPRLSEGAAVLVLEQRSAAEARGARPLAVLHAGRSAFVPAPGSLGKRMRSCVADVAGVAGSIAGAPVRSWCYGAAALSNAQSAAIDLQAAAGCGGGLSGALAVALAAAHPASPEFVTADDGASRVAALLVGPAW